MLDQPGVQEEVVVTARTAVVGPVRDVTLGGVWGRLATTSS